MHAKSQLVCCVKDEAVSILEWIAHHRVIGFDQIIFFSNDCTDGTTKLLDEAAKQGLCEHYTNIVSNGLYPQQSAYRLYEQLKLRKNADVIMVLDIDEFLNIHVGAGLLSDLLNHIGENVDLVCLNWMNFGAGDQERWTTKNVTSKFLWAKSPESGGNRGVKSLILKPEAFGTIGNHHPVNFKENRPMVAINAAGIPLDVPKENYGALWRSLRNFERKDISHEMAQINHYSTKTLDTYCLRQKRGRGWGYSDRHTPNRFMSANVDLVHETSILKYQSQLDHELKNILSLGRLERLNRRMQIRYQAKLDRLYDKVTSS
ncbi:MAG: glycosyltransferase family 2 protein [Pseudomonadota bacterium]